MAPPVPRRPRPARRPPSTRDSAGIFLPQLNDFIAKTNATAFSPTRRAICRGQGATTKTVVVSGPGEGTTAGGANIPVLTAYTSTVVGAAGGPANYDDMLLYATSPGNFVVLGKINY